MTYDVNFHAPVIFGVYLGTRILIHGNVINKSSGFLGKPGKPMSAPGMGSERQGTERAQAGAAPAVR